MDETRAMEAEVIHEIIKHGIPEEGPSLRLIIGSIFRSAEYVTYIDETLLNMTVKVESS